MFGHENNVATLFENVQKWNLLIKGQAICGAGG